MSLLNNKHVILSNHINHHIHVRLLCLNLTQVICKMKNNAGKTADNILNITNKYDIGLYLSLNKLR